MIDEIVRTGNFVVLDTETTGLDDRAEIVQIAVIDPAGKVLLDTLVRPRNTIPIEAIKIHGISNVMVKDAPQWPELLKLLVPLLGNQNVITYGMEYDRRLIHQSGAMWGISNTWTRDINWLCAMEWYAPVYGEWNEYRGNYKWQKLTSACAYEGVEVSRAHSALGDCRMTLALLQSVVKNNATR